VFWTVGGAVLVSLGCAVLLDFKGAAGTLWRFWVYCWAQRSVSPRTSPRAIRLWFGILSIVIGAGWIYAAS
jgi:hypothetical protein